MILLQLDEVQADLLNNLLSGETLTAPELRELIPVQMKLEEYLEEITNE